MNPKTNDIPQGKDELKKLAPLAAAAVRAGTAAAKNPTVQEGAKKVVGGMVANKVKDKVGGMLGGGQEQEQPVVNMSHDKAAISAWQFLKEEDEMGNPTPFGGDMSDVYRDLIGQAAMTLEGGMNIEDYIQSQHEGLTWEQIDAAQNHVRETLLRLMINHEGVAELGPDMAGFDPGQDTCSGCGGQKTPDHPYYGPDGPENGNCDGELPECDIHQGDGELGHEVSQMKESISEMPSIQALAGSGKTDSLRNILGYLSDSESKHFMEMGEPEDHIMADVRRIQEYMDRGE